MLIPQYKPSYIATFELVKKAVPTSHTLLSEKERNIIPQGELEEIKSKLKAKSYPQIKLEQSRGYEPTTDTKPRQAGRQAAGKSLWSGNEA